MLNLICYACRLSGQVFFQTQTLTTILISLVQELAPWMLQGNHQKQDFPNKPLIVAALIMLQIADAPFRKKLTSFFRQF